MKHLGRSKIGILFALGYLISMLTYFFFSGFIAFSTMPELAQKIKMYFALAPIATIKYAKSPGNKFLLLPDMMIKVCDSSENSLSMHKSFPAH